MASFIHLYKQGTPFVNVKEQMKAIHVRFNMVNMVNKVNKGDECTLGHLYMWYTWHSFQSCSIFIWITITCGLTGCWMFFQEHPRVVFNMVVSRTRTVKILIVRSAVRIGMRRKVASAREGRYLVLLRAEAPTREDSS